MMRRLLKLLLVIGGIVLVLFFAGPQPDREIAVRFDPASIGQDVDAYLAKSEAAVANLVAGAEKEIVWANPETKERTALSIVYVHGFSATKHELRPVPDQIAAGLSANLFYTRISGHGRDGEGLAGARLQDWGDDIAEAIAIGEKIGEKVLIIATSNGGAIATWGLSRPELSKNVVGAVLVSPAYEIRGLPTWLANIPWAETILPTIAGSHRSWEPYNELHGKWWTNSYPSRAIFPMTSLLQILKDIDPGELKMPAMFFYSMDDQIIEGGEVVRMANAWGGATRMIEVKTSGDPDNHVLAGDILSPDNNEMFANRIVEWAREF